MRLVRVVWWFIAMAAPVACHAQAWPGKTVRIVTTLAAGSGTDIMARLLAERLSGPLGQPVIVENRPGASTMLGAGVVAKADPDGHTLLFTSSAHTVAPNVLPNLGFDPLRDLTAVAAVAYLPTVLVVSTSKGYRTLQDLVAAARARPGTINFASAAASTQLNAERFRRSARIDAVHIPFKGAPEALNEIVAGRVDFYFSPIAPALPHIREGRIVALAAGGPKRTAILPDLPTTIEAGFPDSDYTLWVGLLAPARTPRDIVARLHKESTAAMATAEARERLTRLGAEPMSLSAEEFEAYIRNEMAVNAVLVKEAGISAN